MRALHVVALAALMAAGAALPSEASAQIAERIRREQREIERERRERERWERERRGRYDDRYDRRDDRYDRGRPGVARGGPAFCRSGAGHPVHGRRWCIRKGFGLGDRDRRDRRYDDRWERARWGDVVIRAPRDRRDRDWDRRDVGDDWLRDVLGDVIYGRVQNHNRSLGWSGPLSGDWFDADDGRVLTIFSSGRALAELVDRNGDGRVEDVRLARIR
jgi:hypothetical protein